MENNAENSDELAELTLSDSNQAICIGPWTRQGITELQYQFARMSFPESGTLQILGEKISHMDTAGAWLMQKMVKQCENMGVEVEYAGFDPDHRSLLELLSEQEAKPAPEHEPGLPMMPFVGYKTEKGLQESSEFLAFNGELFIHALLWIRYPKRIRWVSFLSGIQFTGYNAAMIVALLAVLIGIVLAYQLGVQLQNYGADIYVVDLLGIALLREFAPLLTAIILAGRTGSSYTAQIGTMKLNEEIDAMRTMGLSPIELLVLPRTFALLIALPLLSVLADVFSVFGGMIMAKGMLNINYIDFLARFAKVVALKNYFIGLVKTPVFAVLIASIGCFQGFQVTGSAESVGRHTTTSVVQAIFMIIVADAAFSIIFSKLGL